MDPGNLNQEPVRAIWVYLLVCNLPGRLVHGWGVAYQMAQEMQARGQQVAALVCIDSFVNQQAPDSPDALESLRDFAGEMAGLHNPAATDAAGGL